MKKIWIVIISLFFVLCKNVSADDKFCSVVPGDDREKLNCTFTNEDKSCFVSITRYINVASPPYVYIDGEKVNDLTKTSFTCNSDIEFTINIPLNKGLNGFDQVSVRNPSSGKYEILGLEPYSGNSPSVKCSGADYNIIVDEEDNFVCKIVIYSDSNGDVIMQYGSKQIKNPNKEQSTNSPYICEEAGDSETFTLSKPMKNGSLTDSSECPRIITSAKKESDSAGDNTQTPDRDTESSGDSGTNIPGYNNNINKPGEIKNCKSIFTGNLQKYLEKIFSIMKYLGIVLCIGLSIVDFVKAILDDNKDVLNKLSKRVLTRLLLVALLFFLPTIVNFIVTLIDENACTINF